MKLKKKMQNVLKKGDNLLNKDKKNLKKFMKDHKKEVDEINVKYFNLFNQCGNEASGKEQLGLTGAFLYLFVKYSNFPKEEKLKLLENVVKQVEKE